MNPEKNPATLQDLAVIIQDVVEPKKQLFKVHFPDIDFEKSDLSYYQFWQ